MGAIFYLVRIVFSAILKVFFRDIELVGVESIPRQGPVIFVGNHQNQFVDPGMLFTQTPREIRFITAEKSMRRLFVGFIARLINSIPVRRPQDEAIKGSGTVSSKGDVLVGSGSKFNAQVKVGDAILIAGHENDEPPRVVSILDDNTLKVVPSYQESFQDVTYKIYPKVDQSEMYETVWTELHNGSCIGVFPEGGSHDNTGLLPLKAGVSLMALGAMAKYPGLRVKIQSVGLNYFSGHRFRSFVVVEYGKPLDISDDLVQKFLVDKRGACTELLNTVRDRLTAVTLHTPDLKTLQSVLIARRIYQPPSMDISPDQYIQLTRRLAEGYVKLKDEPPVKKFMDKTLQYRRRLGQFGLHDFQVATLPEMNPMDRFSLLFGRLIAISLLILVATPGLLLNLPVGILSKLLALRHAVQAKKSSTVKVDGRDVVASYKILVSMVVWPLLMLFYSILCGYFWGLRFSFIYLLSAIPIAYGTIRITESWWSIFQTTWPVFLTLLPGGNRYYAELQQTRENLKFELRELVEQYGPRFNFFSDRIVSKAEIERDNIIGPPTLKSPRPSFTRKSVH